MSRDRRTGASTQVHRPAEPKPEPVRTGRSSIEAATIRAQAKDALIGLGWKPAQSRAAIDAAIADLGDDLGLEVLIREALRRCPKPSVRES